MKIVARIILALIIAPLFMATTYAIVILSYLLVPLIISTFVVSYIFVAIGGLDHMD